MMRKYKRMSLMRGLPLLPLAVMLSVVTPVYAKKDKPNSSSVGEITVEVNPVTCQVVIQSEKSISNIIFNLGGDDEEKIEYIYEEGIANPLGNEYVLGDYLEVIDLYDSIHVKAGNNGTRGVGERVDVEVTDDCEIATYEIGEERPGGGIVFYLDPDSNGTSGLEAAPVDQGSAQWCSFFTDIEGVANLGFATEDPNSGSANTPLIVGVCGPGSAAGIAAAYEGPDASNPTSGWFLPNKQELNLLYNQRQVVGGFAVDGYWSSSEFGELFAWDQFFGFGGQGGANKLVSLRVRAVRAF